MKTKTKTTSIYVQHMDGSITDITDENLIDGRKKKKLFFDVGICLSMMTPDDIVVRNYDVYSDHTIKRGSTTYDYPTLVSIHNHIGW